MNAPGSSGPTYTYAATVVRWVDGDTVVLWIDVGFRQWSRQDVRLLGVDTPERGQDGYAAAALEARRLAPPGSSVLVTTTGQDKYGRWLGAVSTTGPGVVGGPVDVAVALLAGGFGYAYDGGPRRSS